MASFIVPRDELFWYLKSLVSRAGISVKVGFLFWNINDTFYGTDYGGFAPGLMFLVFVNRNPRNHHLQKENNKTHMERAQMLSLGKTQ